MKGYKLPKRFCVWGRIIFVFEKGEIKDAFVIQCAGSEKDCALMIYDDITGGWERLRGTHYIMNEYRSKIKNYTRPFIVHFDYLDREPNKFTSSKDRTCLRRLNKALKEFNLMKDLSRLERFLMFSAWQFNDLVNGVRSIEDVGISAWDFIEAQGFLRDLVSRLKTGKKFTQQELDLLTEKLHPRNKKGNVIFRFINSHFYELFEKLKIEARLKICNGCGRLFQRGLRVTDYHWQRKKFCSPECRVKTTKRKSYLRSKEKIAMRERAKKAAQTRKETEGKESFRRGTF